MLAYVEDIEPCKCAEDVFQVGKCVEDIELDKKCFCYGCKLCNLANV